MNVFQLLNKWIPAPQPAPTRAQPFVVPPEVRWLAIDLPQPSADKGMAVVQWHHWSEGGYKPRILAPFDRNKVHGHYVDDQRRYRGGVFDIPELGHLARTTCGGTWSGDIREIDGVAASKGPIEHCASLDEFAKLHCEGLIQDATEEKLIANWRWEDRFGREDGGRLTIGQFAWDERTFWINSGGSHHFAAARYLADKLDRKLTVQGKLCRYELVAEPATRLLNQYQVLGMPTETYDAVYEAFEAAHVPHFWAKGPFPLGGRAVLLPHADPRAQQAAKMLIQAGAADLGAQLRADLQRQYANARL